MTARSRTLLGVGLFLPLAGLLLAMFACLPAPVGDPEKSSVDEKLVGAWQLVNADAADKGVGLALLRPYDSHTYYVQYMFSEKKDGVEKVSVLNYKGWLTKLGDATFITCETLDNGDYMAPGSEPDRFYWVAKVNVKPDGVTVLPVNPDCPVVKELKTRETIEAAIKANIENKDLYSEAMSFKKLGKDQLDIVSEMRKKANLGVQVK